MHPDTDFPIFSNDPLVDKCMESIHESSALEIGPLPGCSREWLLYSLATKLQLSLFLVNEESQYETTVSHFSAIPDRLRKPLDVHCIPFAGESLQHTNLVALNDKLISYRAFINAQGPALFIGTLNSLNENFSLAIRMITLSKGQVIRRENLVTSLVEWNYTHQKFIETPSEFAVRGNIVDIFPLAYTMPVRIEYHDNTILQIRQFDPATQDSTGELDHVEIYAFTSKKTQISFQKLISGFPYIFNGTESVLEHSPNARMIYLSPPATALNTDLSVKMPYEPCLIPFTPGLSFADACLNYIRSLPKQYRIFFHCDSEGEVQRVRDILSDFIHRIQFSESPVEKGFLSHAHKVCVLSSIEIFQRNPVHFLTVRPTRTGLIKQSTDVFEPGDLVVHHSYGVGIFKGLKSVPNVSNPEITEEVMIIEYANESYLHVPKEHFFLLEKYIGTSETIKPALDDLGNKAWQKKKNSAMEAIADYAARILKLEASRSDISVNPLIVTSKEVHDFQLSFPYRDTPDQETATLEIHKDLSSGKLMNRLILGDVGFGKTEIAMRAAFINAFSGYQTAFLAPTTLLAMQHYRNITDRMKEYPLHIANLSRFTSGKEQREILKGLKEGTVDIVIGTHRLLQKDICFKHLNLLIIDEEQKFGVLQKDSIIMKNPRTHILSLSATPIPRTLYLSLMGARNMSAIFTPPRNRQSVDVKVLSKDNPAIISAMIAEVRRGGQIFYVHNRVYNIEQVKSRLEREIPSLRFAVAHGQMGEGDLKKTMSAFISHEIDCLIATSIIESGLDFPNVNTLIVNDAHLFGLADLYQLKGRVGRHDRKAFAYFIVPHQSTHDSRIRKKIKALESFSLPGGGYQVALKDLEIRGAGNILGTEQSGHIANIGFELYCRLLKETLSVMKQEPFIPFYDVDISLGEEGAIPSDFITAFSDRFQLMKSLSFMDSLDDLDNLRNKMKDQFGSLPEAVLNLFTTYEIKIMSRQRRITRIERQKSKIAIYFKHKSTRFIPSPPSSKLNIFEYVRQQILQLAVDHSL